MATAAAALEFEKPIAELEQRIDDLKRLAGDASFGVALEIEPLEKRLTELRREIYKQLTPFQRVEVARFKLRPFTLDYIERIFTDFIELHGDRAFREDAAIIGGWARLEGETVMVIGHQRGRDTKDNLKRNFAMPHPEGYRKALRLMKLAEKFQVPVLTFIDTPGAWAGLGAEERGQSEAIARNLYEMSRLTVPIIATVIGEGGSGGAIALGAGDKVLMMEHAIYSVISPEGCASILWKSAERASEAAEALGITAHRLKAMGLIDKIVNEPVGGAHRDPKQMSAQLKRGLNDAWRQVTDMKVKELLERRYERLQSYGRFSDTKADAR
jgi:acetyl-CoA carboxylase carboxyl transferase subunit alpha